MPRHNTPMTEERMKEIALALLKTCPQMLSACPRVMYKRASEKYGISKDELGEFTMSLFLTAFDEIATEAKKLMEDDKPPTPERIEEVSRIMNACPDNDMVKLAEFAEAHGVTFEEMKACVKAVARRAGVPHYSKD